MQKTMNMRALRLNSFESLPEVEQQPTPEPGAGKHLIRVEACGLNFADLMMISGRYQETPEPPFTLGLEYSGIIERSGPGAKVFARGDRVAVFAGQGGLAEFALAPADRMIAIPDSMPASVAAGFQVAYGTSHTALEDRARLAPGETLLVLGAAGGVGLTAVEIGKAMGARVIAVARGPEKCAVAKAAGADITLDAGEDIRARVKELGGADVVYDPVGGDAFAAAFRATKPGGRILVIGFASGTVPPIPANHLMVKNISVIGHYWGGYLGYRDDVLRQSLATLCDWYEKGRLSPHISHCLPLERANEGLALLRDRKATGKVVITMDQSRA